MLKTNSKIVKERIRNYLKESIDIVLEERKIQTEKPMKAYYNIIQSEKFYQSYRNDFEMFKDFHQGLGGFGADIYYSWKDTKYSTARFYLKEWLEETEEESFKYTESKCEELMVYLCYREFTHLLNKEEKENE